MKDSPDFDFFTKVILIDKKVSQPLYIQVSQQIINVIQRNYFSKGTMLPGTRLLSKLLKVHRNTAVAIYNELASQGWVEIIPNKGTFVLETPRKRIKLLISEQQLKTLASNIIREQEEGAIKKTYLIKQNTNGKKK